MTGFYSETEQLAMLESSLATQWATLAVDNDQLATTLPTTNAGFRELIENFEIRNEQDAETYAQLLLLAPAYAELHPYIEAAITSINDLAVALSYITAVTSFESRKIAVDGDDIASAEYAVIAAQRILDATEAETELYGLTMDNYLAQFEAAHLANELTEDQIDNYAKMGSLIMDVAEAQKAYTDLLDQEAID